MMKIDPNWLICGLLVVVLIVAVLILAKVDKKNKKEGFNVTLPAGGPFSNGKWQNPASATDCNNNWPNDGVSYYCEGIGFIDSTDDTTVCPEGSAVAVTQEQCSNPMIAGNPNNALCCTDTNNCMNFPAIQQCNPGQTCASQPGILPSGLGYCTGGQ